MDFDCIVCVYMKCDSRTKLAMGLTNHKLYTHSEPTRKARLVIRRVLTRTCNRQMIIMADTLLTVVSFIICFSIWYVVYYYVL